MELIKKDHIYAFRIDITLGMWAWSSALRKSAYRT